MWESEIVALKKAQVTFNFNIKKGYHYRLQEDLQRRFADMIFISLLSPFSCLFHVSSVLEHTQIQPSYTARIEFFFSLRWHCHNI